MIKSEKPEAVRRMRICGRLGMVIEMGAPYRRTYQHTKSKGHESTVSCGYCGKTVPRWKTIPIYKGFRISDPVLRKQIDPRFVSSFSRKLYVCPSCARYRGVVKIGRSRKSRRANE